MSSVQIKKSNVKMDFIARKKLKSTKLVNSRTLLWDVNDSIRDTKKAWAMLKYLIMPKAKKF